MLNCIASLLAVTALAFGLYVIFDLKSQITPIVSLSLLISGAVIFALFNLLKPGVIIMYAVAAAVFALGVYKNKDGIKEKISGFLSPGVVMFLISCIAMLIFLYLRQPLMSEWDEFSFWGTSQKLVKIHDALYTFYNSSMVGNSTPPSLAVLSYFFQWANPAFSEWISFFAYDVMFFACYSAFTAAFEKKSWNSAFMMYLFGFLCPYIFEIYTRIIYLEPVYISTYADIPLGVMFAGAVAVYFFCGKNDSRDILPLLPVLMFLTLIKDMGFALSCIVIFIVFFDMVISKKDFSFFTLKKLWGKIAAGAAMLAVTAGSFMAWAVHMGAVMQVNRFELGGSANMGMAQMLITGIKELLEPVKSDKFTIISQQMYDAFFSTKLSMLGSGRVILAIVSFIFLFAFITADKNGKKRTVTMYITSFIGFLGYYVFHIFLYVYIFKDNAYGLVSYNRYIYPYYIGWMCFALFALCLAIKNGRRFWSKGLLFGFTGRVLLMFNFYASYENIFIECNDRSFAMRKNISLKVDYLSDTVQPQDVIYCYSGGDNGERWFIYTYEFASNYIVQDVWVDSEKMEPEQAKEAWQKALYERFVQEGVTHVLIDSSADSFVEYFGELFDVPVNDVGLNSVAYYKVNYTDDWFYFTLVKGGIVNAQ